MEKSWSSSLLGGNTAGAVRLLLNHIAGTPVFSGAGRILLF
jgi:hypothetical protein